MSILTSMRSLLCVLAIAVLGSCAPKEDVVLRRIKDVVVDVADQPMLRANATLYNPNKTRIKLRKVDLEVFVDGKSSATINQTLNLKVPSQSEFTIPIEVKLNLQKMGLADAVFGVLGGKKFKIRYKGKIKITYKAVPVSVPVDYEDEIKIRF